MEERGERKEVREDEGGVGRERVGREEGGGESQR